jgi:hypothetical protein
VVKTISAAFLLIFADYVVAKPTSVTEGYGQGGVVSKKLTALEAPVLLGFGSA